MITEAAIASLDLEPRQQGHVANSALDRALKRSSDSSSISIVPAQVRDDAKDTLYETSAVRAFLRLGAQSFSAHKSEAIWERKVREGKEKERGAKPSIDVSLFNAGRMEETRIEFGIFKAKKLSDDSKKLFDLRERDAIEGVKIKNFVILWKVDEEKPGNEKHHRAWRDECAQTAESSSTDEFSVVMKVCSSQHLFSPAPNRHRSVRVAVFSVEEFDQAPDGNVQYDDQGVDDSIAIEGPPVDELADENPIDDPRDVSAR